jgi:MFS family permease
MSTVMVTWFGRGQSDLQQLSAICAATGFFTNAGVVGLYALAARAFPTALRASGTGFVIGIGRGGAALAPMVAGLLFTRGLGLQFVAIAMSVGSLVGAAALMLLRLPPDANSQAT